MTHRAVTHNTNAHARKHILTAILASEPGLAELTPWYSFLCASSCNRPKIFISSLTQSLENLPRLVLFHQAASSVPAEPSRKPTSQLGTRNTSASALSPLGRSWTELDLTCSINFSVVSYFLSTLPKAGPGIQWRHSLSRALFFICSYSWSLHCALAYCNRSCEVVHQILIFTISYWVHLVYIVCVNFFLLSCIIVCYFYSCLCHVSGIALCLSFQIKKSVGLCVCVCVFVGVFTFCGSVTTITRNCAHRSSPNWVYRYR